MSDLTFLYRLREALGFNQYYPLSNLDSDAKQMRTALLACAPLAHAAIADVPKETLGYLGGADTESTEPVTITIRTTLGAVREARRALFVAGVHAMPHPNGMEPGK